MAFQVLLHRFKKGPQIAIDNAATHTVTLKKIIQQMAHSLEKEAGLA